MSRKITDLDLVILCGGRGARLQPHTNSVPKALMPVHGRAIIDHVVGFYLGKGLKRITLCVGYRGDQIVAHFAAPPGGAQVAFSDRGEDASMLQRIHALKDTIGERFIVAYCDTFTDLDLARFVEWHSARGALATIVTAKITSPFGITTIDRNGMVTQFVEKPAYDYFIGCFLMERAALYCVTPEMLAMPDGVGLVRLFGALIEAGKLAAFEHRGANITFNTQQERAVAEAELSRFYTLRETTPT